MVEEKIPMLKGNKFEDLAVWAISLRASLNKININMRQLAKWRDKTFLTNEINEE
jgi:hypothetical protein